MTETELSEQQNAEPDATPKPKETTASESTVAEHASFEEAISATGFGKFNYIMLLAAIPGAISPILDTTVMSFVIPNAVCDLQLTPLDKGLLNACTFIGILSSGVFWGFLSDTFGRKKILVFCYSFDLCCVLISAFVHNFWLLFVLRLLSGFATNGPWAVIVIYMSEFQPLSYRSKVVLFVGEWFVFSTLLAPLLAWVILPLNDIELGEYVMHSWQIYILVSAIPVFISSIFYSLLPESPKFLLSIGDHENALKILRRLYTVNTGKPEDTYPVKNLISTKPQTDEELAQKVENYDNVISTSTMQTLMAGFKQLKPLFYPPHLSKFILVITTHFGIMLGTNSLRLWLPELFTMVDKYAQDHENAEGSLCQVVNYAKLNAAFQITANTTMEHTCTVVRASDQVYINSIIVAIITLVGNALLVIFVNRFKKRDLIIVMLTVGSTCGIGLAWANGLIMTLILASLYITVVLLSSLVLLSAVVDLFPTSLRGMACSVTIMFGAIGAVFGNIILPILLNVGCMWPFLIINLIVFACCLLMFKLPVPTQKELENLK